MFKIKEKMTKSRLNLRKTIAVAISLIGFSANSILAQTTIQVLDSIVSYHDGNDGVKYKYQYDEKGIAIVETYSYWNSSSSMWEKSKKCEYQYDDKNNQTWIAFYWDNGSNKWVENKKYEYLYNDKNNQTWITCYWDNSSNKWVESKKCEYQYNENKNQTLETCYFWDNGTWTKIGTAQYNYYYSSITVNSIFQPDREQSVSVFPNPATNHITVKGTAESIITISDLSGKIIDKQVMAGESKNIDVSSWASGVYLISVEKENNRTVSKIIKN